MNLQNLQEHHGELLSFMESNGYAEAYVQRFRLAISRILSEPGQNRWTSYTDIYLDYEKRSGSANYLRQMRTVIGAIEQFDIYGRMPDARHRHTLFERGSYHLLIPEFKELIDYYRQHERQRGKKDATINGQSHNAATFLHHLQEQGTSCLDNITEDAVLSFFISEDGELIRSSSYKNNVAAVLKACLEWKGPQCRRLLGYLPALKKRRRNIQYLTKEEVSAVRAAIEQQPLSMRNRAVMLLLILTGIRSSDIACLTLDSIDWETATVCICQKKTGLPLELPLTPVIGNAIFDYLTQERPDTESRRLFLSETWPFSPLADNSIENIVAKVFRMAGIRQSPGERKGTHIFRHNAASSMLENGVQQPVISKTLGHSSPQSLEAYLSADFVHLKECALGIETFPVAKGVFPI